MARIRTQLQTALAATCLGLACAAQAGTAPPDGPPTYTVAFPAGLACANFGVRLEDWGGHLNDHVLKDRDGLSRSRVAGLGGAWRLTNLSNGKSVATRNKGATALTVSNPADGSQTVTVSGHLLLIWFPTDLPAGPWTRLHSGQVVYGLSATYQGTLISTKGSTTDVCAALQ